MKVIPIIRGKLVNERHNKVIWLLLAVYTFLCGSFIPAAKAANLSCGEYVLLQLVNHYYIVYGLCIYWLFWCLQDLKEYSALQLIRSKNYVSYFTCRIGYALVVIVAIVLLHILIPLIIGCLNLELDFGYQGHKIVGFYTDSLNILLKFSTIFLNLPFAILITGLYLIIGLLFIYELLLFCQQLWGNKYTILAVILVLLNIMLGFKIQIDESMLEVLFLNNYFIIHHPLLLVGKYVPLLNLLIMLLLSIALWKFTITKKRGRRHVIRGGKTRTAENKILISKKRKKYSTAYIDEKLWGRKWIIVTFSLAMAALKMLPAIMTDESLMDYCFRLVKGYPKNLNGFIDMLAYVFFFIVPIVFIDTFWDDEKTNRNLLIQYRYNSAKRWNRKITIRSLCFMIRYFFIYWGIQMLSIIPMHLITNKNTLSDYPQIAQFYGVDVKLQYLVGASLVFNFMELLVVWILNAILVKTINNTTIAFVATYIGYALGVLIPTDSIKKWILFGDASLETMMQKIGTMGMKTFFWGEVCIYVAAFMCLAIIFYMIDRKEKCYGKCNRIGKSK